MSNNGAMTLPTLGWPDFQDGRVLTHNDLNRLRDYLYTKYLFQNRSLFGFGVACGLGGSVDGKKLTIAPGFALAGRELLLDAPFEQDLGGLTGEQLEEFDFVDPALDGYTAVLCPDDTPRAAGGECDPDDCTLHTDVVDEGARVVFARGRLKVEGVFSHEVFQLSPIAVDKPSKITGFGRLQQQLVKVLRPELGEPTLKLLSDLDLTGPPGVDLMKVGILNEVLYAAWEYFRCRAYGTLGCFGEDDPECVALGWVSENGTWAWHCRYRHHFVLSRALFSAIRGSRCEDLCQAHLDRIRAILETFEPPPAKEDDPPKDWPDDPPHICDFVRFYKGKCHWWKKPDLIYEVELPPVRKTSPLDPIWRPPEFEDLFVDELFDDILGTVTTPEDVVVNVKLDPYGAGILPTNQFLGYDGDQVADALGKAIQDRGVAPTVQAVSMETFGKTEGLRPGLAVAATDAIYLGTNSKGTVISVGVVPTSTALGEVPGIRADAQFAKVKATELETEFGTLGQSFTNLGKELGTLKGDFGDLENAFKGLKPDELLTLTTKIDQKFATIEARLPSQDVLQKVGGFVALFETMQTKVDRIGTKLSEVENMVGKQGTEIGNTKLEIETTKAEIAGTQARMERTFAMQAKRVDDTVGEFVSKALDRPGRAGFEGVVTRAPLVRSLESMTTAIEAAAPEATKDDVRAALEEGRPALDVLRGAPGEEEIEGQPVNSVLESMLAGLRASGLATESTEYRRARRAVTELRNALEAPEGP